MHRTHIRLNELFVLPRHGQLYWGNGERERRSHVTWETCERCCPLWTHSLSSLLYGSALLCSPTPTRFAPFRRFLFSSSLLETMRCIIYTLECGFLIAEALHKVAAMVWRWLPLIAHLGWDDVLTDHGTGWTCSTPSIITAQFLSFSHGAGRRFFSICLHSSGTELRKHFRDLR